MIARILDGKGNAVSSSPTVLPTIALIDDDYHSSRFMTRTLALESGPHVFALNDAQLALDTLRDMANSQAAKDAYLVLVDLKASSTATLEFIVRLKAEIPGLLVAAMAPSLDRSTRSSLLEAGAAAVFERHADLVAFRREAACIVSFLLRNQGPDTVPS